MLRVNYIEYINVKEEDVVLNKLKKLLMKKENNPPLPDPRDTGEEKEWDNKSEA